MVWLMMLALSLVFTPDSALAAKKRPVSLAPAPTPKVEATWVWNTYQIVYEKDQLLQFAKSNGVNLIYLQILQNGDITKEQYRTFIREAGLSGIEVRALDGRPEWAWEANRHHITDLVNWVKQYNASVVAEERFRGVHLDVEPYILPEWSTDQSAVVTAWMDTVNMFITQVKSGDATLKASSDIPAWLEYIPTPNHGGTLSRFMISKYDQVTLMAYRDFALGTDGILDIVKNEIAEANQLGKSIIVGVNIIRDPEGDMVSFAEEGRAEMERQISLVYSGLQGNASFAGHAVHDYNSWRNALP
jgi:hypothetical protein